MNNMKPLFFILIAAILWGTTGTAQAFSPPGTHPVAFGAVRLAIGGGVLLLLLFWQRKKLDVKNLSWPKVLLASFFMACYQPLFFSAVLLTGIAVGTVIAIGSSPMFAGLFEWIFTKKIPPLKWWIATLLAISGCILLFLTPNTKSVSIDSFGILSALGAGLSFALYTLISKGLIGSNNTDSVVAILFTISAIMLAPLLFFLDISWFLQKEGLISSLYIGICATGLAYFLFTKGLLYIPASTAVTLSLAEPLTAALLGVFLIGEVLPFLSWIGVVLLFLSILVLSISLGKETDKS